MKKLVFILFIFQVYCVNAQSQKAFIDAAGNIVNDSTKAKSYLIYKKISDSTWSGRQYSMDNIQLIAGTYKDANLSVLHGRFFYYRKANLFKNPTQFEKILQHKEDTTNYITTIGTYLNGKRNGLWTDYFSNGKKRGIYYYTDNKLNGAYEEYGTSDSIPMLKGNYSDGLRQGVWNAFSIHGNLIETEFYRDGVVTNTTFAPVKATPPAQPDKFDAYLKKGLEKSLKRDMAGNISVTATITASGKIKNQEIQLYPSSDSQQFENLKDIISRMIDDCPLRWAPGFDLQDHHLVDYDIIFFIQVIQNEIKFEYSKSIAVLYYLVKH